MIRSALVGFVLTTAVTATRADTAYDNLGPSNSFDNFAWSIGYPTDDQRVGMMFMSATTGRLTDVTAAVTHYVGQNDYTVELHAESCG
jgi:hypothetical protein